jgi:hypothetical protein
VKRSDVLEKVEIMDELENEHYCGWVPLLYK